VYACAYTCACEGDCRNLKCNPPLENPGYGPEVLQPYIQYLFNVHTYICMYSVYVYVQTLNCVCYTHATNGVCIALY
jgi:hypothetical protein